MTQAVITCTTCRRRLNEPAICHPCRDNTAERLNQIPTLLTKLHTTLTDGTHPAGEQIGRTHPGPKLPANTILITFVTTTTQALAREQQHPVAPDRHQLSLPQWVTAWASVWRQRADHHTPPPVRAQDRWSELDFNSRPQPSRTNGEPATRTLTLDLKYLATWLPHACDEFDDTPHFVRQLRTLTATASAAVGEPNEAMYLGDCPEPVINRRTGLQEVDTDGKPMWCGASLYHRPDDGRTVRCGRCRTITGDKDWFRLALRMRDVWGVVSSGRAAWQ